MFSKIVLIIVNKITVVVEAILVLESIKLNIEFLNVFFQLNHIWWSQSVPCFLRHVFLLLVGIFGIVVLTRHRFHVTRVNVTNKQSITKSIDILHHFLQIFIHPGLRVLRCTTVYLCLLSLFCCLFWLFFYFRLHCLLLLGLAYLVNHCFYPLD